MSNRERTRENEYSGEDSGAEALGFIIFYSRDFCFGWLTVKVSGATVDIMDTTYLRGIDCPTKSTGSSCIDNIRIRTGVV